VSHLPLGGRESAAKRRPSVPVREQKPSRGKNSPRRVHLSKRWDTQSVEKAKQAGAPFGGREPSRFGEKPLGFRVLEVARF
jgi:hypothetical protein